MKKIRIEFTNVDDASSVDTVTINQIQTALDAVNGNANAFTLTDAKAVLQVIQTAEYRLMEHNLPPSDRVGTMMTYRPAGPVANAYKYKARSTEVRLRRNGGETSVWYLEDVKRVNVYPSAREKLLVTISDKAMRNVVKRALADFGRTTVPTNESKVAA